MANIDVSGVPKAIGDVITGEVEGVISAEESVSAMIDVIQTKGIQHTGTFWTWENKV